MSLANSIIIMVMSRCDFDTSCSELTVHHGITNNHYFSIRNERMHHLSTNQIFEARIFRMNCHTSITQHSFNSSGSNLNKFSGVIFQRIFESNNNSKLHFLFIPRHFNQSPFVDIDMFHLNIRNSSFKDCRPVHQPIGSVNQPTFKKTHKRFPNCF